jgi:hypothetical protein
MDNEHRWFTVRQLIDRDGIVTNIIPGNLPPGEVQNIRNAIESARYLQRSHSDPVNTLVPDVDHNDMPFTLNGMTSEPTLSIQGLYPDATILNTLVPDVDYDETSPSSDDMEEGSNLFVQMFHTNPTNLDTSVPDAAHDTAPLILGGMALAEASSLSTQETHTDSNVSDTFVPNMDYHEPSLTLSGVITIQESNFHH